MAESVPRMAKSSVLLRSVAVALSSLVVLDLRELHVTQHVEMHMGKAKGLRVLGV